MLLKEDSSFTAPIEIVFLKMLRQRVKSDIFIFMMSICVTLTLEIHKKILNDQPYVLKPFVTFSIHENETKEALIQEDVCSICLDAIADHQSKGTCDPCHHDFHQSCIEQWMYEDKTCPLCRIDLIDDEEEEEEYKKKWNEQIELLFGPSHSEASFGRSS